jgi:hypothetical protein
MPTVREIENFAFQSCDQLTDVEMPDVESMRNGAFSQCTRLRRIAIPLKDGIIAGDYVFDRCENLSTVDIVGGIHKTIFYTWRAGEMK